VIPIFGRTHKQSHSTDATVEVLLKTPRRGLLGKLIKVIMQLGRLTLNPSGIISNILQQKAKKLRREK